MHYVCTHWIGYSITRLNVLQWPLAFFSNIVGNGCLYQTSSALTARNNSRRWGVFDMALQDAQTLLFAWSHQATDFPRKKCSREHIFHGWYVERACGRKWFNWRRRRRLCVCVCDVWFFEWVVGTCFPDLLFQCFAPLSRIASSDFLHLTMHSSVCVCVQCARCPQCTYSYPGYTFSMNLCAMRVCAGFFYDIFVGAIYAQAHETMFHVSSICWCD